MRREYEIVKLASVFPSRTLPPREQIIAFSDEYRHRFSVEPIYRLLNEHTIGGFSTPHGYRLAKSMPAPEPDSRPDLVGWQFTAASPTQLWVADITYVRTLSGPFSAAFVTAVYSRKIVGRATRSTMATAAFLLAALEQAIMRVQKGFKGLLVRNVYFEAPG